MIRSGLAALLALAFATATQAGSSAWVTAWAASPSEAATPDMQLSGRSIEQPVRVTADGTAVRLRLSNAAGTEPITVGGVRVGGKTVLINGSGSAVIAPGAEIWTDPVALETRAGERISTRIYLPDADVQPTIHWYGGDRGRISPPGNWIGREFPASAGFTSHRVLLSAVDVHSSGACGAIVAIGDSLTDGSTAPPGERGRWTDVLAERLRQAGHPWAVVNAGIGGDRLLRDAGFTGTSPGILGRLNRDVFSLSSPRVLILLAGTNDIGWPEGTLRGRILAPSADLPSLEALANGYRQVIERARAHGMLVLLGTVPPLRENDEAMSGFFNPQKERLRQAVNGWIRSAGVADGVVDFDKVLANAAQPDRLDPNLDSGDGIHPSAAGYTRMGETAEKALTAVFARQPVAHCTGRSVPHHSGR